MSNQRSAVVREFITTHRHGLLSTVSQANEGYPFGSIVPYDLTPEGDLIIYVSLIAEHYKNLIADSRASVTIVKDLGVSDPQAEARATVLLRFNPTPKEREGELRKRYETRFPNSVNHELAHNFVYLCGRPERIRWIGGFGDIAWVSGESYREAHSPPIAYIAESAIHHMHADHYGSLIRLAKKRGVRELEEKQVLITNINATTCTLTITGNGTTEQLEFAFANPVTTSHELRSEMMALVRG